MSHDLHTRTAMWMFDVGASEVTEAQRRGAKAYNYAKQYGASNTTATVKAIKAMREGKHEVYRNEGA
ncbi:hypothetical protein BRC2024_KCUCJSVR_CDS_0041 [Acinetobacter phage vB_AbaM_KissB]